RDESGAFEIQDRVDDIADFPNSSQRMEGSHTLVGRGVVRGGLDDAEGDGIDPDALAGVFDRQRTAGRHESAFGQGGERGWPGVVRLVDEGCRDVDNVAATPRDHLLDGELGEVEEPGQVDSRDLSELLDGVLREWLAEVDPSVVDQRVDPAKAIESLLDRASRGAGVSDVASDRNERAVIRRRERTRHADDGIPGAKVPGHETRTDALRRAG